MICDSNQHEEKLIGDSNQPKGNSIYQGHA